jgi:radical SAM protein with 4Fe4S-binding SPASM domain
VLDGARRFFPKLKVGPGLYTYRGRGKYKGLSLQLRVEPDGEGVLAINANTVLFMNETATTHAYFFIKGLTVEDAVKAIKSMYKVSKEDARKDHEQFLYTVNTLAKTKNVCPISYLGVERIDPFSRSHTAPIRMDLALTFRCQNDCLHCYAGGPRETPELSTSDWIKAMQKVKDVAIFIVTFTGGEPTLRGDLAELVRYTQENGLVSGLVTNGRRLSDKGYVQTLSDAGLDFVQITLESHLPEVHDKMTCTTGSWVQTVQGIKNALSSQIYVSTNTTLTSLNVDHVLQTLEFVGELGVKDFSCNSLIYSGRGISSSGSLALPIEKVKSTLSTLKDRSEERGMNFTWFTPTRYCELNPVNMGLGIKSCSAALLNMCIGPNGDVYPCQSYFKPVGNILRDSWKGIWNNPLCVELRGRKYTPEECKDCSDLQICGAGCPLELADSPYACQEGAVR